MAALWLFMALLLGISAAHKLTARKRLSDIAARLAGMPPSMGPALLLAAAAVEALAAAALLFPPLRLAGAIAAAALWLSYGMTLGRRRGQVLDCGCDLVRREKPVSTLTVARPLALAALAIMVALVPVALAAPFATDTAFAALALLALYFAGSELAALPSPSALRRTPA